MPNSRIGRQRSGRRLLRVAINRTPEPEQRLYRKEPFLCVQRRVLLIHIREVRLGPEVDPPKSDELRRDGWLGITPRQSQVAFSEASSMSCTREIRRIQKPKASANTKCARDKRTRRNQVEDARRNSPLLVCVQVNLKLVYSCTNRSLKEFCRKGSIA